MTARPKFFTATKSDVLWKMRRWRGPCRHFALNNNNYGILNATQRGDEPGDFIFFFMHFKFEAY